MRACSSIGNDSDTSSKAPMAEDSLTVTTVSHRFLQRDGVKIGGTAAVSQGDTR